MYAIKNEHKLIPWGVFLRWKCIRCGRCCSLLRVRLLEDEVKYLTEKYGDVVEYIGNEPYLKHKSDGCIFLTYENGMAKCTIYEDRPLVCRVYPFHIRKWGSVDVRIGERTSTLGLISLSSLWVHGEQVIGLDPVQGNPTSPTSHCPFGALLPPHSGITSILTNITKYLTVSKGEI